MFAALSTHEKSLRVLNALNDLLGDTPSRADYVALLATTRNVSTTLQVIVNHMPSARQMQQWTREQLNEAAIA